VIGSRVPWVCRAVHDSTVFQHTVSLCVLANLGTLLAEHHNPSRGFRNTIEPLNTALTLAYVLEAGIKGCGHGWLYAMWSRSYGDRLDTILAIVSLLETGLLLAQAGGRDSTIGLVLATLKVLRSLSNPNPNPKFPNPNPNWPLLRSSGV